jgi:hypothetical protein
MNNEKNERKSVPIAIKMSSKDRTISEEYNKCSPNTKKTIDFYTDGGKPSSNRRETYTNVTKYNESSSYEQAMMVQYGLIPPTMIDTLVKMTKGSNNK